jgi:hypothetical protein
MEKRAPPPVPTESTSLPTDDALNSKLQDLIAQTTAKCTEGQYTDMLRVGTHRNQLVRCTEAPPLHISSDTEALLPDY